MIALAPVLLSVFAAFIAAFLILAGAWAIINRVSDWAARHIETLTAQAIARPLTTYQTIDAEYRALVAAEQHDHD